MENRDEKIDELADKGVKKYLFRRFLYFLKNHGITINMFLLICILVTILWYGRPIYDRFDRLPQKIEKNEIINKKQDSLLKINDEKSKRQESFLKRQFEKINDNFITLIEYRNSDKKLLKKVIESNRPVMIIKDTAKREQDSIR